MAYCSRGSASACKAQPARGSQPSTREKLVSISILVRFPMPIRICIARAALRERESTRWTPSIRSSTGAFPEIFRSETGFDIYTRAISDAYQDLYREGSFTGKGIYEVDALHQVLDRRFPRNSLLSHDLLEGA